MVLRISEAYAQAVSPIVWSKGRISPMPEDPCMNRLGKNIGLGVLVHFRSYPDKYGRPTGWHFLSVVSLCSARKNQVSLHKRNDLSGYKPLAIEAHCSRGETRAPNPLIHRQYIRGKK